MEDNQNVMIEEEESSFDFMQLWRLFKKNWKWFPISIVVCVLIAGVYLWITPTTVSVSGKMEIIDKSKKGSSGMSAGLALLNSLPLGLGSSLGGSASLGIEGEKEILTSTTLVRDVVKDLGLYTEYRLSKWGKKTLLYQNNPIMVSLDPAHVDWLDKELPLTTHQILLTISKGSNGYEVETRLKENKENTDLPTQTFASLPATIKTEAGTLTLTENKLSAKQAKAYEGSYTLKVSIAPPTNAAKGFIGRMSAEPPSKKVMNILTLSLQDENLMRGLDFINHLVEAYNKRANDEKNEEARKTDEFVRARLAMVDAELTSSDAAWENSKKNFQITTPEVDAQEALTKKSEYEAQLVAIDTQLQLHDYLSDYINNPANLYELIPVGMNISMGGSDAAGNSDGGVANSSLIARHNGLVSQRKDLLKSVSEMSPQVQRLTESIRELHPDIQTSMKRQRESIVMQKRTLEREFGKYSGRIGSAPQMERVLTEIGRQREIKQGVYLVMLQKREETAMELANTTDKGRFIDAVQGDPLSVTPQKKIVLLVALFLGALLPMGVLYLLQMLKTKIDTREELEAATQIPFLAEIPIANNDEAFRNLRTNLLLNLKPDQKTILVASLNDGDGKTFIAQHLVDSLKVIGKETAYVCADYRKAAKPGEHAADVLASADFAAQIHAGQENNDYVIIDTPALGEYNDALQVAQFVDATLYIVKSGKTKKSDIEALNVDSRLPHPMLILNN